MRWGLTMSHSRQLGKRWRLALGKMTGQGTILAILECLIGMVHSGPKEAQTLTVQLLETEAGPR